MPIFPLDPQQHPDLTDFIAALNKAQVDYLIVGAYAVMAHSETMRATKDLDVYVNPDAANLARLKRALEAFGAPQNIIDAPDAPRTETQFEGFTFGRPPARVDVLTKMAIPFDALKQRALAFTHDTLTAVTVIGKEDLILLKQKANRTQDRHDIAALTKKRPRSRTR